MPRRAAKKLRLDKERVAQSLANMGVDSFLRSLGVDMRQSRRSRGAITLRCPVHHGEDDPNASVRIKEGRIVWKCWSRACEETHGRDGFGLIAGIYGLDAKRDFQKVMEQTAYIAGLRLEDAALTAEVLPIRRPKPVSKKTHRTHHPIDEVRKIWESCQLIGDSEQASSYLSRKRALNAAEIEDQDLARVLPRDASLPWWAKYRGKPWTESSHRIITPMFNAKGVLHSLHAWSWDSNEKVSPICADKFTMKGLVFANGLARLVLTSGEIPDWWGDKPMGLIIAEGEPDFLSNATIYSDADEDAPMVLGIGSGWWTDELASRIPKNTRVIIRTHEDEAGENYAKELYRSLKDRVLEIRRAKRKL